MKELAGKTFGELQALLAEKREALRVFRFDVVAGKIKNVKAGREIRTAIARIFTLMNSTSRSK